MASAMVAATKRDSIMTATTSQHAGLKPLSGVKVVEIEGIGPAPFCGQFLHELGAEVTLVKRPSGGIQFPEPPLLERGKTLVTVDLKSKDGVKTVMNLIKDADCLIEGMRPGVMEKLGLGPKDVFARNQALIYGRVTGWGQDGPLSHVAGHDINYAALSGALWYGGQPGQPPFSPPSLLADIGGGALYLTIGILSALLHARTTGEGQVIDAAMVDGSAHMMNLLLSLMPFGQLQETRGQSLLDGPHWYNSYLCADGEFITIGSLEPKFYALLLDKLELSDDAGFQAQMNAKNWPDLTRRLDRIFRTKTQAEWCEIMEGTDICFAPVLSPMKAAEHPHIKARGIYREEHGGLRAATAPRFSPLKPE